METVILVIHLMVVVALIAVVLLQRSEGGALGIGGGGGGSGGGFMSARGAANALTRTTAILAAVFFVTSITLGVLSGLEGGRGSILDDLPVQQNQEGTGNGIFDQLPSAGDSNEDAPEIPTSE